MSKNEKYVGEITAIMREADTAFEKVGGSTRHYVRDLLLPMMEDKGLFIYRVVGTADGSAPSWVKTEDWPTGLQGDVIARTNYKRHILAQVLPDGKIDWRNRHYDDEKVEYLLLETPHT